MQAIIEIIHAFTTSDLDSVHEASMIYSQFLMAENTQVSFAAKQALIRALRPRIRRRRVLLPSPPPNEVTVSTSTSVVEPPAPSAEPEAMDVDQEFPQVEPQVEDVGGARGPGGIGLGGIAGNLDALLAAAG